MGWLGTVLILLGAWQIGHKKRVGFLWGLLGELAWAAQGAVTGQLDLFLVSLIFVFMHVRNWKKWRDDDANC